LDHEWRSIQTLFGKKTIVAIGENASQQTSGEFDQNLKRQKREKTKKSFNCGIWRK